MFLAAVVAFHTASLADPTAVTQARSASEDAAFSERAHESRTDDASLALPPKSAPKSV